MDEMQLIKDLRRSIPAITPDAEEVARTRLAAIFEEPARPRSAPLRPRRRARRFAWRAAVAGGMATSIAVGVTVALSTGGESGSGGRDVRVVNAAEVVLDRAATAASSASFTAPRPDQWVYQHTQWVDQPAAGDEASPRIEDSYRWTRASDNQVVDTGLGRTGKPIHVPAFPPQSYASVAKLPVEPEALLHWIRTHRPSTDETTDFGVLSQILRTDAVLPPELKATIFQAMKKLPGVTLRKGIKDLRGRAAIAVVGQAGASMGGVRLNEEVLLDPATYTYRGEQTVLSADLRSQNKGGGVHIIKAGTVTGASVNIQVAIVDRSGQRS